MSNFIVLTDDDGVPVGINKSQVMYIKKYDGINLDAENLKRETMICIGDGDSFIYVQEDWTFVLRKLEDYQ